MVGSLPIGRVHGFRMPQRTRSPAVVFAVLVVLSGLLALPALDNGFSLDDYNWLERAQFRDSTPSFVLTPEPGQVFNPIGRGAFLAMFVLAGTDPLPYRVGIVVLHTLNVWLVFLLTERAFKRRDLAIAAAALFAVQSSYDEALFWIAAFFHPLNASFCLAALLGYLVFLESESRVAYRLALLAFSAALLTKAPAFTFALLFPAAFVTFKPRGSSAWRILLPFAAVWAIAVAINIALRIDQSYLLERGYYAIGWHALSNLAHYLAWMAMPFEAVAARLDAGSVHSALLLVAKVTTPVAALVLLARGSRPIRFFTVFGLLAIAPFLFFVFEPTSRYTYLSAAGFAPVVATGLLWLCSRLLPRQKTLLTAGALILIGVLALADRTVVDNTFEYREDRVQVLVADVERALPNLPGDKVVRIANLPRFGIDPGIHLEAALRLAYGEPELRLQIVPAESASSESLLRFESGRVSRSD